jgi:hypothetical protein
MEINLTEIIMAVITLLFGLLMRYLVPSLKNNMDEKQMEMFRVCVKSAVYAAEQLYGSKQGQEKLAYVIKVLDENGYKVNKDKIEDTTRVLIESFVKELNLEQKKVQEE